MQGKLVNYCPRKGNLKSFLLPYILTYVTAVVTGYRGHRNSNNRALIHGPFNFNKTTAKGENSFMIVVF